MSVGAHRFVVEPRELAIVRLGPSEAVPAWARDAEEFVSITRTRDEISIVCSTEIVPDDVRAEAGWTALELVGPFPFDQVGVLSSFVGPLAEAGISIFAISTFDTDYVLVKTDRLEAAVRAVERAGHLRQP
ncbi:MAG TPA: ACT domain-containing protein [Candidatus Polarisedimenticolaceae bacterium]|nr:ACT domain-containing protein [Candidatus Polarisedimenticolaceae bacterium]